MSHQDNQPPSPPDDDIAAKREWFDEMVGATASASDDEWDKIIADANAAAAEFASFDADASDDDLDKMIAEAKATTEAFESFASSVESEDKLGGMGEEPLTKLKEKDEAVVSEKPASETGEDLDDEDTSELDDSELEEEVEWEEPQWNVPGKKRADSALDEAATVLFGVGDFWGDGDFDPGNDNRIFDRDKHDKVNSIEEQIDRLALVLGSKKKVQELKDSIETLGSAELGLEGFTSPLGQANRSFNRSEFPVLSTKKSGEKWELSATKAVHAESHTATVHLSVGDNQDCGMVIDVIGTSVVVETYGGKTKTITCDDADAKWKFKKLIRGVSQGTFDEIVLRELEHLSDFTYAFGLATIPFEKAATKIAGNGAVYDTREAAIDALVEELTNAGCLALVPKRPYEEATWTDRLLAVTITLSGESSLRDNGPGKTHIPRGYRSKVTSKIVFIEPIPKTISLKTENFIKLADVSTVYSGKPSGPVKKYKVGESAVLNEKIFQKAYQLLVGETGPQPGDGGLDEAFDAGTEVKVVALGSTDEKVWVSAPCKNMDSNVAVLEIYQDQMKDP